MKRIKQKLRSSGGVTLVEMLCAVFILMLLGMLLNTGLQMAVKSYHDSTAESETQLLLSTLADALADKLRYTTVEKTGGGSYGPAAEVSVDANGQVLVDNKRILPNGAYGRGKYAAELVEPISTAVEPASAPTDCYFTVKLKVREASGDGASAICAETTLTVRCLNPVPEETSEETP